MGEGVELFTIVNEYLDVAMKDAVLRIDTEGAHVHLEVGTDDVCDFLNYADIIKTGDADAAKE